jgi:uncharacterized protein
MLMTNDQVVEKTRAFIEEKFKSETTGHDYWHMYRVWQTARHIAERENEADMFVVELAALLHDIADWKFSGGDEAAGPREARKWLESLEVDEAVIKHVEDIIINVDFKGAEIELKLHTIEGKIVHDADKLDALGAVGVARAFATGAHFKEVIHDPSIAVPTYATVAEYRKAKGAAGRTVINHFYEKLLLLKDRMFTATGKEMAQHRHEFMEHFLREFYQEWDGQL